MDRFGDDDRFSPSSKVATRVRISSAALLVNVTARIAEGGMRWRLMR